jgi:divalent metal cation (Fe/Co/Zn/Cd) transporter
VFSRHVLWRHLIIAAFTVYAAISALSFSLLATGIDAIFDFGSNVLLFWLHRKASRMDVNEWPVGGARLETIGNIVYGASAFIRSIYHLMRNIRLFVSILISEH